MSKSTPIFTVSVTLDDFLTTGSMSACSPEVMALKDYVNVNISQLTTTHVPIFNSTGGDRTLLGSISDYALMGLMNPQVEARQLQNLLVGYCIAKALQGYTINVASLQTFVNNKSAPGVANAIKVVCQRCRIDPAKYPTLGETVRKLELLLDSFRQGSVLQPDEPVYKW